MLLEIRQGSLKDYWNLFKYSTIHFPPKKDKINFSHRNFISYLGSIASQTRQQANILYYRVLSMLKTY